MFEKMKDIVAMAKRDAAKFMENQLGQASNITGIAMAIFVLVVIGYVSIYVVNEIHGIAGITSGSVFYTASTKVINVMNTSWGRLRARIRQFKAYISDSRESYENLDHQNDAHRRYKRSGLKNVYSAGGSGVSGRNHSSNSWRIRWQRKYVVFSNVIDNNRRGGIPSPHFIFST